VLVMIIVGWMVVLPAVVVAALYHRSSASAAAAPEPVDADALIQQITAFTTAEPMERLPSPLPPPAVAGGRTEGLSAPGAAHPADARS
jgi:hypothetical protein